MEIKNIEIKYFEKSEFIGLCNENIKHVKVLPYLSIVQSTEGSYDIALANNKSEQTEQGGFFIAPSNVQQTIIHHVNKQSGRMSARWIFLDVEINKTHLDEISVEKKVVRKTAPKTNASKSTAVTTAKTAIKKSTAAKASSSTKSTAVKKTTTTKKTDK